MNNEVLRIVIIVFIFWMTFLYFYWKGLKHYIKLTLSFPGPRDVICLVSKKDEK